MSKRVELNWPNELVSQIDYVRGDVPRSVWIRRAAEFQLKKKSPTHSSGVAAQADEQVPSTATAEGLEALAVHECVDDRCTRESVVRLKYECLMPDCHIKAASATVCAIHGRKLREVS